MSNHIRIHEDDGFRDDYHGIDKWLSYLGLITILVFLAGMISYGESFSFRDHAYSHFGRMQTQDGSPNTLSMMLFMTGMMLSAYTCIRISNCFTQRFEHILFRIIAVGFLLLMIPCDLMNPLHSIGGAAVFGCLWLHCVLQIRELTVRITVMRIILLHIILQGSILPYAFFYAISSPICPLVQKPALAGLIIILKVTALSKARISDRNNISVN